MNDEELLEDFTKTRNLKDLSKKAYRYSINIYVEYNQMTMQELLDEAETEEENGIRWKKRKLKKRLIEFRNYLYEKYLDNTAKNNFSRILSFYRHYEIEIHELPPFSRKNIRTPEPINFKDLPDKDIIKQALKITTPLMRAVILFMSSSGCARRELLNLTVDDFIKATKEYHYTADDIYEVIRNLKDKQDIIPQFYLKRQKTNKHYVTFCSPEATNEIINYLLSRQNLTNEDKLFKVHTVYLNDHFKKINETLNLGKKGPFNRFRSHMLRKFHASQLYNDGMALEIVDSLQGRGKDSTHSSYFMEDPNKLKEIYIEHLNAVTINLDVENITFKSKEYNELEAKYENEKRTNEENTKRIDKLEQLFQNSNILDKI